MTTVPADLPSRPRQATRPPSWPRRSCAHDEACRELASYKLGRVSSVDDHGSHRVMCPAQMGKLRCGFRPESMALGFSHPEVLAPPPHAPRCCRQQTMTVPEAVTAKTAQKHDYSSAAHRRSYNRRTASERTFAWLADPATIGMRRGWCRLMGRAKNALMFTLGVVVRNVRLAESFEARLAEEVRRASTGGPGRRRRRERDHVPGDAPSDEHPHEPG